MSDKKDIIIPDNPHKVSISYNHSNKSLAEKVRINELVTLLRNVSSACKITGTFIPEYARLLISLTHTSIQEALLEYNIRTIEKAIKYIESQKLSGDSLRLAMDELESLASELENNLKKY